MRVAFRLCSAALLPFVLPTFLAAAPYVRADDARRALQAQDSLAERADAVLRHFAKFGLKAKFGAVEAGPAPDGLMIRDIEFTAAAGSRTHRIERIEIRRVDWTDPEHPRFASFSVRGLTAPAEVLGRLGPTLGLATLTVHLDIDYRFDDAKKTFEIPRGVIDIAELGELRFRLNVADLAYADYRHFAAEERRGAEYEAAAGRLAMASFAGAALSFKDRSLVARLIRSRARAKGITEEAAKARLIQDLAEERRKADDASLRELIDAAARFLVEPGEISVVANPPPGISLLMLSVLLFNPTMLGLTVTVN